MKFCVFKTVTTNTEAAIDVDRIIYIYPVYEGKHTYLYFGKNDFLVVDIPFQDVLFNIELLGAKDLVDEIKIRRKYSKVEEKDGKK